MVTESINWVKTRLSRHHCTNNRHSWPGEFNVDPLQSRAQNKTCDKYNINLVHWIRHRCPAYQSTCSNYHHRKCWAVCCHFRTHSATRLHTEYGEAEQIYTCSQGTEVQKRSWALGEIIINIPLDLRPLQPWIWFIFDPKAQINTHCKTTTRQHILYKINTRQHSPYKTTSSGHVEWNCTIHKTECF